MGNNVVRLTKRAENYDESKFRLTDGVQVRQEGFGLLFYNYRGPRLYFVPSKAYIGEDFFDGIQTVGQLADVMGRKHAVPRRDIRDHLARILQSLEAKGLIHEQPLC